FPLRGTTLLVEWHSYLPEDREKVQHLEFRSLFVSVRDRFGRKDRRAHDRLSMRDRRSACLNHLSGRRVSLWRIVCVRTAVALYRPDSINQILSRIGEVFEYNFKRLLERLGFGIEQAQAFQTLQVLMVLLAVCIPVQSQLI